MREMKQLPKLKRGDKVAILSPSVAAPGKWPHIYELGLSRLRGVFGLETVDFPSTSKIGATTEERAADLIAAFEDTSIKAVIASLGGDDQITYIKNLPSAPFVENPKPFFGFSDNTHFENFLWLNNVPSFYGGSLFTQFAMQKEMDEFTVEYLKHAFFDAGEFELRASDSFNDISLPWEDLSTINTKRTHEDNEGWYWDGTQNAEGITWGGCVESIDEILRHGGAIPSLEDFKNIILFTETSEEVPTASYVRRVYRALGERGILERVRGVLVGRPKAWEFNKQQTSEEKRAYKEKQREVTLETIRTYNKNIPVIQNFDIGHTDPQIALPQGGKIRIDSDSKRIFVVF
jgi:muramoyltetrapeptide carboxypeptidase LdcA involved in peptidoglycan recycling